MWRWLLAITVLLALLVGVGWADARHRQAREEADAHDDGVVVGRAQGAGACLLQSHLDALSCHAGNDACRARVLAFTDGCWTGVAARTDDESRRACATFCGATAADDDCAPGALHASALCRPIFEAARAHCCAAAGGPGD
jgi:hypothetical protein